MIVKIDRKELQVLKKICALSNVSIEIFTMESNELMVQVEILENNGREIDAKSAWHIRGSFECEIQMQELKR